MVFKTLALLSARVTFHYFPLNHIDPAANYSFLCKGMDCPSTQFDSCLVKEYCWPLTSQKPCPRQLAVSRFLACFEGQYANEEAPTNASRREPCMAKAGLDYELVLSCKQNQTALAAAETALNATRAPMYRALGPNPGLFPHIFVDGEHLNHDTWTALTRILCQKIKTQTKNRQGGGENEVAPTRAFLDADAACRTTSARLHFHLKGVAGSEIQGQKASL